MTISYNSKPTGAIIIQFYIELPGTEETKYSSNTLGYMSNMAAMQMFGKNRYKSSSEPIERWP